ncbi:MAG: SDR family oxidoreductase [Planctomycetota bacterium]
MSDRVVLLAGATGRVGEAVAREVLAAGGKIAAAVRKQWQVEKVYERLGRERVLVGVVGARDAEAAAGFVKGASDALGTITAFVGAAGSLRERVPGKEPGGDLDELLEANLHANATLARAVLTRMRRRGDGALHFFGMPEQTSGLSTSSRASKAALVEYVEALRADLVGSGVAVHVVPAPLADQPVVAMVATP